MKIINKSKNTISLEELNITIPFLEDYSSQEISDDLIKNSKQIRQLKLLKLIDVVEDNSLLCKNIKNLKPIEKIEKKIDIFSSVDNGNSIEVSIKGHFFEAGGYAKVNRNLAVGLNSLGVKVAINPVSTVNNLSEKEVLKIRNVQSKVSKNAITIDSIIPSFANVTSGKYKVLYTTVESCTVPDQFIECIKCYNEIWVPSDFCKEVLEKYDTGKKIFVIPNSFDKELYKEDGEKQTFNPKLKSFVFGSVFGWSYRKGYQVLLRSFLEEFSNQDDVTLLLISRFNGKENKIMNETIKEFIQKYKPKNNPNISLYSNVIPEKDMPNIYRAMNCHVLFSLGEGFGLPVLESAACGVPNIATNHSGYTMFLNNKNGIVVDPDKFSVLQEGKMHVHYWDGQVFPELKSEDFIKKCRISMRDMFNNNSKYVKKNKKLKKDIDKNYTIEAVSKLALKRLEEIKKENNL